MPTTSLAQTTPGLLNGQEQARKTESQQIDGAAAGTERGDEQMGNCTNCGSMFRLTRIDGLSNGECAACGADWPMPLDNAESRAAQAERQNEIYAAELDALAQRELRIRIERDDQFELNVRLLQENIELRSEFEKSESERDEARNQIAAAVAHERERARPIEVALRSLIEDIENFPGEFDADSESVADARQKLTAYEDARTEEQAAAIRARK